jgi:RNA polymerase sigma-70 factor (ECF subfamily)
VGFFVYHCIYIDMGRTIRLTESDLTRIIERIIHEQVATEPINFDKVYKSTYPNMFRQVCMKYANGDYDLASEYCQLGYLRVNDKLHTFKVDGSLEGWIRRVITTTIINEFRAKKRKIDTTSDFDFERNDVSDEPEERYEDIEFMGKYTVADIKNAIDSLPKGYQFVFYQYFYKDKSHKEIADALGIDEGTSRSQLSKAKKKIKDYLESLKR